MRLAFQVLAAGALLCGMFAGSSCSGSKPACGPSSCAGCCDTQGICQPGTQRDLCGSAGAACQSCGGAQDCRAGACAAPSGSGSTSGSGGSSGTSGSTGSGLDGGNVPVGDPCASAGDCQAGPRASTYAICFTNYPSGACTVACDTTADCPGSGVVCYNAKTCFPTCSPAGAGQTSCRSQYLCDDPVDAGTPICVPDCRLASGLCPAPRTCQSDGLCR